MCNSLPDKGLISLYIYCYSTRASLITQKVKVHLQCRRPRVDSWVRTICWRRDRLPIPVFLGFCYGSAGKETTNIHIFVVQSFSCNPMCCRKGGLLPGWKLGFCLPLRNDLSEETHVLTKLLLCLILLGKGAWVESSRVREPRRTAVPSGHLGFYGDRISFWVVFSQPL